MVHFSKLILTIGIPGAGKTTWVQQYKKQHPLTFVISTDALRKELTGCEQCVDPSQNGMIHEEARKRAKKIIDDPQNYGPEKGLGPEIIIDSTNVEVNEWMKYKDLGASVIVAKIFEVEPKIAMKHQENRERFVPQEILEIKWKQYQENKKYLPFIFNMIEKVKI